MMQTTTNKQQGSGVKVNRQLCFDSAVQLKGGRRDHIHHTPQTLKSLLESERKPQEHLQQGLSHSEGFTYNNPQQSQHKSIIEDNRGAVLNLFSQQQTQYQIIEVEDNPPQEMIEEIGELIEDDDDCDVQIIEPIKQIQSKKDPRKPMKERVHQEIIIRDDANNNINNNNLKMSTIEQLANLKQIVAQKQLNQSMQQYNEALNKLNKKQHFEEPNKENSKSHNQSHNNTSNSGFNEEEKKIIYNPKYLRRLGLPQPDSIMKPKGNQPNQGQVSDQLQQQQQNQHEQKNMKSMNQQVLQEIDQEKMLNRGGANRKPQDFQQQSQQVEPSQENNENMSRKAAKNAEKLEAKMEKHLGPENFKLRPRFKADEKIDDNPSRKLQQFDPNFNVPFKLSDEEKKLVYYVWVHKNMQDFNYWIQKSKSILTVNFSEEQNIHACELHLLPGKHSNREATSGDLITKGGGTSKREAKKTALERLAWMVITDDDLFWDGITGAAYIAHLKKEYSGTVVLNPLFATIDPTNEASKEQKICAYEPQLKKRSQIQSIQESEIPQTVKSKIQKQNRKVIEVLKSGRVAEALDGLATVATMKPNLNFRDFCYIWSYAAHNKDLTLMKVTLDVVHHRKFTKQMKQDLLSNTSIETIKNMCSTSDSTNKYLNKVLNRNLRVLRTTQSDNAFEVWNPSCQLNANDEMYYKLIKGDASTKEKNLEQYSIQDLQSFSLSHSLNPIERLPFVQTAMTHDGTCAIAIDSSQNGLCEASQLYRSKVSPFEIPYFKRERKIQPAVTKQMKDENLNYLQWDDLNCMYQNLLYQDDPIFCLQACQLIYAYSRIDDDTLLPDSSEYYRYKKLTIYEDFFESLQKVKLQMKFNQTYSGSLVYLGSNYEEELFSFKVWAEVDELITVDQVNVKEGDLCEVLDASGNNIPCILKSITETSGVVELRLSSTLFGNLKNNLPINTKYPNSCLSRLFSVQKTLDKSKSLDAMCTKISLFHPIFKALVDPAKSAQFTRTAFMNSVSMQLQMSERVNQISSESQLNEEQSFAVKQSSEHALTIISGAKYTGKFRVATCAVTEWLEQSNTKVVVKCRYEQKGREFFNFFMNDLNQAKPHLHPSTTVTLILDSKGNAESYKAKVRSNYNLKSAAKLKKSIEESRLVIVCDATPQGTILSVPFSNSQFNRVLIYEAEQHREDDCLEFLVKNCNQCVLIGDFSAVVRKPTEAVLSVSRHGDRSILESVPFQNPIVLKKRYFPSTKESYAHIISNLHSSLFYENNSNNYSEAAADSLLAIDVKGAQECIREDLETEFSHSYNAHEAHLTAAVACNLIREKGIELSQIMIVAATQTQRHKIERAALTVFHMAVRVQSINEEFKDSYDYVLYSGVMSNSRGIVGNAMHSNVLSTLLQHSSKQFIFIGDVDLYGANPLWREIFTIAHQRKQVRIWGNTNKLQNGSKKAGQF